MITEEMLVMALKYDAQKKLLGYTFFRNHPILRSDGATTYGAIVAIYDKDGNPCPKEDFIKIHTRVILEYRKLYKERKEHEESIKNI